MKVNSENTSFNNPPMCVIHCVFVDASNTSFTGYTSCTMVFVAIAQLCKVLFVTMPLHEYRLDIG